MRGGFGMSPTFSAMSSFQHQNELVHITQSKCEHESTIQPPVSFMAYVVKDIAPETAVSQLVSLHFKNVNRFMPAFEDFPWEKRAAKTF